MTRISVREDARESLRLERMVAGRVRSIEKVPPLFIGLLEEAGKLPALPRHIEGLGRSAKARAATLEEVTALTWLVAWDGPKIDARGFVKPVGVAAYRDTFDYHTASDVRELVHVAGSRRSVRDLVVCIRDDARAQKRRLVGCIDVENVEMAAVLQRLDGKMTRVMFEDTFHVR